MPDLVISTEQDSVSKPMDISKINFYNGAICASVLAVTAPTDQKSKECVKQAEEDLDNLMLIIKAKVTEEAQYLLDAEPSVFEKWFRKNIKNKINS